MLEVLLVHPGGPFWKNRDDGAWSIPKGEVDADEDLLAAARRELAEETGVVAEGELLAAHPRTPEAPASSCTRGPLEGDCEAHAVTSNLFRMEWPPRVRRDARVPRSGPRGVVHARPPRA